MSRLRGHRHALERDDLVHAVLTTSGGWHSTREVCDLVDEGEPHPLAGGLYVSGTDAYSSLMRLLEADRVDRFYVTSRTIWWRAR